MQNIIFVSLDFCGGELLLNLSAADPRFANIQTDPRFRLPSQKNARVQIDKRFAHMLHDDDFSSRAKVDRYGRKLPKNAGREELKKYYRIADEDLQHSESEGDEDPDVERELDRVNAEHGESSSSDDSSSDEESDEAEEDEVFGVLDNQDGKDGIPQGEISSRLAVVNLDWDNIRAADLMAVFSSFAPSSGRIRKVSIYPSQFGKERLEREELDGPPKEIFGSGANTNSQSESTGSSDAEDEEKEREDDQAEDERIKKSILQEDQGQEFNSAKLRRYQLERLRYYYAVLECSSTSVAQAIYDAVDGIEYLSTANFFDLRYIPDETDFAEDEPRDECERIPDGYRPNEFVTDALQHSKVRLTWDADDGTRKEAQKRAFAGSRADLDENDLKAYLGSDSSEDEGPQPQVLGAQDDIPNGAAAAHTKVVENGPKLSQKEAERQKMRALLGLEPEPTSKKKMKKDKPVGDMQITFSSGLSSDPKKASVFENEPEPDETTAEKYIRKEKERKARRKEKMKAQRNCTDPSKEDSQHQDQSDKEASPAPDLGFSDPFFIAPIHDTAITASQRKADKRKKREDRAAEEAATAAKRAELELLLVDDNSTAKDMNHFDINEIAKAEKALSKKKKSRHRKVSEREAQALAAKEKDSFHIDVDDERFKGVFEASEFAIDPSHPRFKGTEGMKRLLEEGRKKRRMDDEGIGEGGNAKKVRKKDACEGDEDENRSGNIRELVDRIKGKSSKQR